MSDLRALVRMARDLRARGEDMVVATVVGARGSTYRRPGARMIATSERWVGGSVSGGCIEGELLRKMRWRLREARAVVTTYDATDEDARVSFGLGCNGAIDVLQEIAAAEPPDPLAIAERCIALQTPAAVATVVEAASEGVAVGDRVALVAGETHATLAARFATRVEGLCHEVLESGRTTTRSFHGGAFAVFVELLRPPPRLFVLGANHDAVPVVEMARAIGWDAIVCAPHARVSVRERFACADELVTTTLEDVARRIDASHCALGVVMNHDYDHDKRALAMLLRSRAAYIGVLGPRARTTTMLAEIGHGTSDERVHAPVGLAIGAETPEQIALSILAEAQAVVARAPARSLRELTSRIHKEVA